MRLWYLRRAIPWVAVGGACASAVLLAAVVQVWPSTAWVMVPFAVACCACAAAFVLDEAATAVAQVSPRGGAWRVSSRLVGGLAPMAVWTAVVTTLPAEVAAGAALWLTGIAACLLGLGASAVLGRAGVVRPSGHVTSAVVAVTTLPLVVGPFLGWHPIFPVGEVESWMPAFWLGVAAGGAALSVTGLRRTPVRHGGGHRSRGYGSVHDRDRGVRAHRGR